MPDPQPHPQFHRVRRTALIALLAGLALTAMKFGVFLLTDSAAVLSDALESIINVVAAAMALWAVTLANKPPDKTHPYGHGKIEFVSASVEGGMILAAAAAIGFEAIRRLVVGGEVHQINLATLLTAGIAIITALLAWYVGQSGKRYDSSALRADAKHLRTDVITTLGVTAGLIVVSLTGVVWIDAAVALLLGAGIAFTGIRLIRESLAGLLDEADLKDTSTLQALLNEEIKAGRISGYHKLRLRHQGRFHWIDLHLQVDPDLSVEQSHNLASDIEHRLEQLMAPANATAHVEPDHG